MRTHEFVQSNECEGGVMTHQGAGQAGCRMTDPIATLRAYVAEHLTVDGRITAESSGSPYGDLIHILYLLPDVFAEVERARSDMDTLLETIGVAVFPDLNGVGRKVYPSPGTACAEVRRMADENEALRAKLRKLRQVAIDVAISMNEEKFGALAALRLRDAVYKSEAT